jgi:hypothetical protein
MMSSNFTLEEFLHSDTANQIGASNYPSWEIVDNLRRLADTMERIRAELGGHAVTINSGYRSPPVNDAVGGATNSAHLYGLACDFTVAGFGTPADVVEAIRPHLAALEIDQLIYEVTWVHLGLCEPPDVPRCECFRIG